MTPLLHDIVRDTLKSRSDMEVVGDLSEGDEMNSALGGGDLDVVIFGARQPDDEALARPIFLESPFSKVLAIATSGRTAVMYQLRPHKRLLGDVSPQSLIEAIRDGL